MADTEAAEMLLLARGELNRAFRQHGLTPPDPLPAAHLAGADLLALDDPAAEGIQVATARYADIFQSWAGSMPRDLVHPVSEVLRKTHEAMVSRPNSHARAVRAVLKAYEFLNFTPRSDSGPASSS